MVEYHLDALDIHIKRSAHFYHDEGYVPNVRRHIGTVLARFAEEHRLPDAWITQTKRRLRAQVKDDPRTRSSSYTMKGYCLVLPVPDRDAIAIHTMYTPQPAWARDLYIRAEEQAHALHHMEGLPLLERELHNNGFPADLRPLYDPQACTLREIEMVGMIGALYACHRKQALDIWSITPAKNVPFLNEAISILRAA